MTGRVAGKAVLVTGAGASGAGWGNGKASAVLYAREGARVLAVDVRREAAEETAAIVREEGGECRAFAADVADGAAVAAAVDACLAAYGRLDVLHNNVGIASFGGPVELDEAEWERVVAVNQTGMYLACKHAIPHMLAQGAGAIVNVSSVAARRWVGVPMLAYSTTKAAVIGLTRSIALQYAGRGIRANCILPGLMDTPMVRGPIEARHGPHAGEVIAARHAASPTGRMGDAWDVAFAALFLASDEARYVNGTEILVDGGLSASATTATAL